MKQFSSRFFSAALVLALLCGLVAPARAANEIAPTRLTLDKSTATVYLHGDSAVPVRLTSAIQPSDFNGTVKWSVPAESKLVVIASDSTGATISAAADAAAGTNGVVTVTATSAGTTMTATCTVSVATDSIKSKSFGPFTVEAGREISAQPNVVWLSGTTDNNATGYYVDNPSIAAVSSQGVLTGLAKGSTTLHASFGGESLSATVKVVAMEGISLDRHSLNLSVGDESVALTTTIRPAGLTYTPTFTTSNASVATVSADGRVTALRAGAAVITARVTDSAGTEYTDTCTVSVAAVTGDVNAEASVGTDLSMKDVYAAIADRYAKAGGSGNPTIAFNSIGSSAVGTLYMSSAKTTAVDSTYYGSLSLLEGMVFAPASTGRYIVTYTASSSGKAAVLTGTITIEVKGAVKNVHIGIGSASEYLFSEAASGGSTGAELLSAALGNYGSLRFGSVVSGSSAGTLYADNSSGSAVVRSGTVVNRADVSRLYYVVSRDTSYQIEFSAYSGANATGTVLATGTLTLGAGSDSLNVTVSPDGVEPYRFGSSTRGGADSADAQLRSAINANVGASAWKYVRFDADASVNTCGGTLYTDSTRAYAVNANTYVAASDLDDLYFVPTQSGVYEIGYSVCAEDVGAAPLSSGRLRIVVSSLSSGTAALYYNLTPRDTLAFRDDDFEAWYAEQRGSGYHLEYVRFDSIARSFGTLYHNSSRLTAGGSYSYYTADYYSAKTTNARRLSDVSFTAPSSTGYQELTFTCYGRSGSSGSIRSNSGTLRIYVTSGSVSDIAYDFGGSASALTLREEDFEDVYRSAMAVSTASPAFYIQLLELPDAGTLYSNYKTATGRGTELTSSTASLYPFYVNGASTLDSVGELAYVPSARGIGTYPVRYAAFSRDGEALYVGTVTFRYSAEVSTVNVTDGYSFRAEDVCGNANTADVRYVVFDQPALGRLYLRYANGRGTLLPNNTKLYVSSASYGSYPVSDLTYIPRADMDGEVSLGFTAYTAGRSYSDKLTLTIEKKTASATFRDVTPTTGGTWAANAVDFAAKWNLVNGVDAGLFAPGSTMRRCDLVLILYRSAGSPAVSGTLPYTDIPANAYYRDSALWAANNSILSGVVTGTTYNPGADMTRQEFARILYNYTAATGGSLTGSASLSAYTDSGKIAAYARDAMAWAVARGYINGTSPTTLSPGDKANRAQIATLLHRYLTL